MDRRGLPLCVQYLHQGLDSFDGRKDCMQFSVANELLKEAPSGSQEAISV